METTYPRPLSRPADDTPQAIQPLCAAVLYTKGKALDGDANDDLLIIQAIEAVGLKAESVDLANLTVSKQGIFTITDPVTGDSREWQVPDAVLMYHGALAPDNTGHLLDQMEKSGSVIVNGHLAWQTMTDKFRFYQLMNDAGVPTIPTRLVKNHNDAMAAIREYGWPAVFKTPVGTEGDDVYVVASEKALRAEVTSRMSELGGKVIAQPFIESRIDEDLEPAILERIGREAIGMRNDFRIMTLLMPRSAPQIVAAFHRIAQDPEQVVNNVAKGSREVMIEFTDLHPNDQRTVWCALNAMPDAQIVGWDLIGAPGERVIMEANSGPGLPLMPDAAAAKLVLGPCAELVKVSAERARSQRINVPRYL
ncbi:MAG: hypothetical protein H7123_06770 [Thermoleophilia bacterium]|nr:hypothetical protein [Thermoleophilia bacterium]